MTEIPGGAMAKRPLHFIWLLDRSGSMTINGKISELNFAVREAIPEMRRVAGENPTAQLLVRALAFSSGADWQVREPVPVEDFEWPDLEAYGVTDMGGAFELVAKELQTPPMPSRALKPVLALVSDGAPTDDWRGGLGALDATPWGSRALRVAIAIGQDADTAMLQEFLANPEVQPLTARNPKQLAAAIQWVSTVAVRTASSPHNRADDPLPPPPPMPADDADVW